MNLITTIDTFVYNLITKLMSTNITAIMMFISHLGSAVELIALTIALIILLKNKRDAKFIAINLVLVFLFNRILKFIIARPRPEILRLVPEDGYSFPSGHTMIATIFYGFIIYLVSKSKYKRKTKIIINSLLTILILLIGISRIYLGVHYATDVIASYLISISYLIIFTHFTDKKKYNKH
jgi:undecaprenyl-diphosphatase